MSQCEDTIYSGGSGSRLRLATFAVSKHVAEDILKESPIFGKWEGIELSEDNHKQLWVPPGFAHWFVVNSESADFLYKTINYYAPEHDRCILWSDPVIDIQWQADLKPRLSAKDMTDQLFANAEMFA
jgi:dTDP-4-dehydrorhamnose 3,5-epimerase